MTTLVTRWARLEDADAAVAMLRDSITTLCTADHHDDPVTLEEWLRNKTTERFARWIQDEDNRLVVADADATIVGIALLHKSGEIRLCYVRPGFERRGVGRSMLATLETQAREWGISRLRLRSSATGRSFYERSGYVPVGEPTPGFGISRCFPYEKVLVP